MRKLILTIIILAIFVVPALAGDYSCGGEYDDIYVKCSGEPGSNNIDRTAGTYFRSPYLFRFTDDFYFGTETEKKIYGWGDNSDWIDFDSGWGHYAGFTYTGTWFDFRKNKK